LDLFLDQILSHAYKKPSVKPPCIWGF